MTTLTFAAPVAGAGAAKHHAAAAMRNKDVATQAIAVLREVLSDEAPYERILLKAAAGAGKSYALRRMVRDALEHPRCSRVGVVAFANKQLQPLASSLGKELGKDRVCLLVSKDWAERVADDTHLSATVVSSYGDIPDGVEAVISTTHMLERVGWRIKERLGPAANGERLYDVLLIDEAWQLPHHRFAPIRWNAPIVVGVGDVGQLPPLDNARNPWRGDPGHNPYRAWPTDYPASDTTWARELPAVWRPTAAQLALWRAFYTDWDDLTCVAAPDDRAIEVDGLGEGTASAALWSTVGSGVPTLLEVAGLPDAEAPDIDRPLLGVVEQYLDELLWAQMRIRTTPYDGDGFPLSPETVEARDWSGGDPVIAVLATRNAAVDDAQDMVDRLNEKHDLPDGWMVASTVDSWQGQTNTLTIAIHPLSGATRLDEFNSAFGRLAVTCTRATHGLLLVARAGLDDLLAAAPAIPGTPMGEPGTRELPRQTHRRILRTFARGRLDRSVTEV